MRSKLPISTPVALGLLAVASSQAFDLVATLAMERDRESVDRAVELVEEVAFQHQAEPAQPGADRNLSLQALDIVDPQGDRVIRLSGVESGSLIALQTPDGDVVADFGVGKSGEYFQTVRSAEGEAMRLFVSPRIGTTFGIASPDGRASIGLRLHEERASLGWRSPLAFDPRFTITSSLSLSGHSTETREYLPGELVTTLDGPSGRTLLGEHSPYSAPELRAAIADAAFSMNEEFDGDLSPADELDDQTTPEDQP